VRGAYVKDCELGLRRWNMQIQRAGHDFGLALPSTRFRRAIGAWAETPTTPDGTPCDRETYANRLREWFPSEADRSHVRSLMQRVVAPGKMAAWIAPPDRGINNLPVEYEYVRLN